MTCPQYCNIVRHSFVRDTIHAKKDILQLAKELNDGYSFASAFQNAMMPLSELTGARRASNKISLHWLDLSAKVPHVIPILTCLQPSGGPSGATWAGVSLLPAAAR